MDLNSIISLSSPLSGNMLLSNTYTTDFIVIHCIVLHFVSSLTSLPHPPPYRVVYNMHELKTDVGRARGWVRLALEKKALSRHLGELFSHDQIITK